MNFSHNNGHVSRNQMRQCLLSNGFLLSDEEVYALEERFNDDVGFNYFWFLKEVDVKPCEEHLVILFTFYCLHASDVLKLSAFMIIIAPNI